MATLSNPTYFYNQDTELPANRDGAVGWGGNSVGMIGGNCTRIVRYTLTTGANEYASAINISMKSNGYIQWGGSDSEFKVSELNNDLSLYFIIGTSPTEHITADRSYAKSGNFTGKAVLDIYVDKGDVGTNVTDVARFNVTLSGEYNFAPNSTYYLWIFPGYNNTEGTGVFVWYDKPGCYTGELAARFTNTITLTLTSQCIYISNGTGWDPYEIYIDNGTSWDLCAAYIDNGSGWDLCQ